MSSTRWIITKMKNKEPNQVTGANSRCAGHLDGWLCHSAVIANASALPAAVAQVCH
jgi:hypothetical protein